MGIIARQTIKGTIWSYLGVIIGFITTGYLFPNFLSTEVIGLFGLLVSWSVLFAQFFSFGFNSVTSRLFPYFRDKHNGHNGFIFLSLIVLSIGFIAFLVTFFFISPLLIEKNIEKSTLFSEYIYLLIPITFFTLLFNLLDSFNRLLYNAVFGTFLLEFLQRLLILFAVVLYILGFLQIDALILLYCATICIKGLIILLHLLFKKEISLKPKLNFISSDLRKEIVNVAFYGILTGIGGNLIFNIDKIVVNYFLGIEAAGIYTIASFFGTLVLIPSRPLQRISGTLIAEGWKRNDTKEINIIYKRSCLNQTIIAGLLLGGIWININNILTILGSEYYSGKWAIFFIALGAFINMATGVNGQILNYSRHYKKTLMFLGVQIVVFTILMFIFIPLWGVTGAGLTVFISFLFLNFFRWIYLYRVFNMQPFSFQYLTIFVVFFISFIPSLFIPQMNLIPDIIIRSTLFVLIYIISILTLKISTEANNIFKRVKAFFF